ncbi:MAG TPA: tetratricopeptide repeat protein [Cyclobacteriaceae bacterium]|nr:tetratricopeptide repeat protein [Cyclobacteriaceae bacterium]
MKIKNLLKRRIWPLLVSVSSAMIMLLAFFIPSLQDQWDRYQSRRIIQQYVAMGDEFVSEENFTMAEQAFTKAYELSGDTRLDIEVKRLKAKVNRIYQNPEWGSKPPEGLEELDFQFLLHMQAGEEQENERAQILTSYGIYLASIGKQAEAERKIREALRMNPSEVLALINLGNLLDEHGKKEEAEKSYRKAITLAPRNARAHYNLAILLSESGHTDESVKELNKVILLDPSDSDAVHQRDLLMKK